MYKFDYICVVGYGWSGSSAVVDLLKEYNCCIESNVEFRLIKDPYGIDDLYHNLVAHWDILTSDNAIRDFLWHMQQLYHTNKKFSLVYGLDYETRFGETFIKATEDYITELVDFKYDSHWWFLDFKKTKGAILSEKILRRGFGWNSREYSKMYFSHPSEEKFISATRTYINTLFEPMAKKKAHLYFGWLTFKPSCHLLMVS